MKTTPDDKKIFNNPIIPNSPKGNTWDPYILRYDGYYYHCYSNAQGVYITRSETLWNIGNGETIMVYDCTKEGSLQEWFAPELHHINGRWYIYAAPDYGGWMHTMTVLVGEGDTPMCTYRNEGAIRGLEGQWTIDGTIMTYQGKLYFIWSNCSALYLAKMVDPCGITGDIITLSRPEYPFETKVGLVIEGPAVLYRNGKVHIVYSANDSKYDDYCLGLLTFEGEKDIMNASHWVKTDHALFEKTDTIFGPGHCSFTTVTENDREIDYIVYHANLIPGLGWAGRNVFIQPFTWDNNDVPVFDKPKLFQAGVTVKIFQSTSRYNMGIDCSNVRLGWSITASRRGLYQTAYHIVIIDEKESKTWDSGWVESNNQVGIVAQNLRPETIYTAKVQIKDEHGQESAFSEGLIFETAPIALEGEWLTSKRLLRKKFTLDQPLENVKRARCYMSSAGLIELRLNGKKVGDLVWNPTRTVHTKKTYYNAFDITERLLDGRNVIGAYTSETDGYYKNYKVRYNLVGMLRIYYKDGSVQTVSTGDGWMTCATSEIIKSSAQSGEDIDARLVTNWDTSEYVEDKNWVTAPSSCWEAIDGELTIPEQSGIFLTYQSFDGDYTIELRVTVNQGTSGLWFGAKEEDSTPLMWQIVSGGLRIHYPGWTEIKVVSVPEIKLNQKITMKLDIRGNTVTTYIDGKEVHKDTVPTGKTTGFLGIRSFVGDIATYDNLSVIQEGRVIWEDKFDFADAEKWNFPVVPPKPCPAVSGSIVIGKYKPISVKEIKESGKTSYVMDFGQNMQGVVRLDAKGEAGTSYLIEYSEMIDEDTGDIWANTTYHFPKSTYIFSGGDDSFVPRFFYTGFRYVKVTTSDESAINPDNFTACFLSEDLDQTGFFESSNERLNKVFNLYRMSQLSNILGMYTDCPQREKAAWTGDASVTKKASLLTLNDYAASEAFMELMMLNIQSTGAPCNQLDLTQRITDDWNMAWTSSYFVFPYEVYMATGDTYYIEKYYKQLLKLFDFFMSARNIGAEYIKSGWNTYDWVGYDNQAGRVNRDYLETAYFYYDGKLLSEMLDVIGVEHRELDARLDKIFNAIQKKYYNNSGFYSGQTQTENAMALGLGLVPENYTDDVLATLVLACNQANNTLRTGVLGTKSLYDVLSKANRHKLLLDMTLNPEKCSFGYYLDHGATTLWEFWDVAGETFHSNISSVVGVWDSQNHVMFGGGLATWMFEGLGGITNSGAGYTTSTFRPGIESELEYANTSINALVGDLTSKWKMEHGDLIWTIEVPTNTIANVIIPLPNAQSITESGKDIFMKNGEGITYMGQNDKGEFIYTVGGGSYSFRVCINPLSEIGAGDTGFH